VSTMLERAALAMLESDKLEGFKPETLETYRVAAMAGLLAALDPEDPVISLTIFRAYERAVKNGATSFTKAIVSDLRDLLQKAVSE